MKQFAAALFSVFMLVGCAVTGTTFGASPEAQIKNGADLEKAGAVTGNFLLKNKKITVVQAKSYNAMLHAGLDHLNDANVRLEFCRKETGSTQKTTPDPCAAGVEDDVRLGVAIINEVKKTLDAK